MENNKNNNNYIDDTFDDMDFDDGFETDESTNEFVLGNNTSIEKSNEQVQNVSIQDSTLEVPKEKKNKKVRQKKQKGLNKKEVNRDKQIKPVKEKTSPKKLLKSIIAIALILILLVLALKLNAPKNSDKHIIIADNKVAEQQKTESITTDIMDISNNDIDNEKDNQKVSNDFDEIKYKESQDIELIINTKLDTDKEYTDHNTHITLSYDNVIIGFDKVKKYVDKYNENGSNVVNIGEKKDFYKNFVDSELVMYELTLKVPDDFPTNDAEHGYTGIKPTFSFHVEGTDKKETLITKRYEFGIPIFTSISDDTSEVLVGEEYKLRFIAAMPKGLTAQNYNIVFKYNDKLTSTNLSIKLESIEIPE